MRECRILLRFADLDAAEPADEIGIPILAPEFPVGHHRQSGEFLTRDDVANRRIFDRSQSLGIDLTACKRFARRRDFDRAQQTADMVGVKKRLRADRGRRHRARSYRA